MTGRWFYLGRRSATLKIANGGTSPILIERLLTAQVYPHEVLEIELLETHISWVILTGVYAYKIKKPVDFGFVDYSTLTRRKRYCDLEIQLNQRFAAELYLGVVPISEAGQRLRVGDVDSEPGDGPTQRILEYAVKMRQFPQDAIVAARLEHPDLTSDSVADFGHRLAQFHHALEPASANLVHAEPRHVLDDVQDNFTVVERFSLPESGRRMLADVARWTARQRARMASRFSHRLAIGKVRQCHGDLHLKNMIQLDGQIHAFDGIEFNEYFQWIDVLSELAFPVMDFIARGRPDLGWRLLNAWLEAAGDYLDLDVLRFYLVYRAMVRMKVSLLNDESAGIDDAAVANQSGWEKYLRTAQFFASGMQPGLTIMHGFSGSGKSTMALNLIESGGGIRIRTDVERHRRFAVTPRGDKYSAQFTDRVYHRAHRLAASGIRAGFPVIVDGTFLTAAHRHLFARLAAEHRLDFQIIDCQAPYDELCQRIRRRHADPSEATVSVLEKQMREHDPLTPVELQHVRRFG